MYQSVNPYNGEVLQKFENLRREHVVGIGSGPSDIS
jgi:hypothetical protein